MPPTEPTVEPMPTDARDRIRQQLIACAIAYGDGADAERERVVRLINQAIRPGWHERNTALRTLRDAVEAGDDDAA